LTFFCSGEHFAQAWPTHKELHTSNSKGVGMQDLISGWIDDDCEDDDMKALDDPKKLSCRFPPPLSNIWAEVSSSKLYTPRSEDVGRMLRLEISTAGKGEFLGDNPATAYIDTSSVLPEPEAPPARGMYYTKNPNPNNSFKAFTYNILADMYANRHRYPYCPLWSLLWTYRRNNILREILNSQADIIGLQEVQADHFDNFLYPKLKENGYEGIFKKKTRTVVSDNPKQIDGCAIFYKEDRFALTEQYSIEYNEAARQHVEQQQQRLNRTGALPNPNYQSMALKRLCKGNIALVVVLEDISAKGGSNRNRRKRRLCIANTHIFWDPEYNDVKLWQTLVLCQELEKLVLTRNLPLIICGDFNSTQTSAVYQFLRDGSIPSNDEVFNCDEYHVLPPPTSITHRLPLTSSYGEVSGEPKYTNYTGDFVGVLDYVFYTTTQLKAVGVLKVDDEQYLREYTALPSPRYPSDHIPLLAEFEWLN
jgi:CCR4-NOT transcription complex subunit 6